MYNYVELKSKRGCDNNGCELRGHKLKKVEVVGSVVKHVGHLSKAIVIRILIQLKICFNATNSISLNKLPNHLLYSKPSIVIHLRDSVIKLFISLRW